MQLSLVIISAPAGRSGAFLHMPARVSIALPRRMHTTDATAKMLYGAGRRTGEAPCHQWALPCICPPSFLSGSTFLVPEEGKDKGYAYAGADFTSDLHSSPSHTARTILPVFPFYR